MSAMFDRLPDVVQQLYYDVTRPGRRLLPWLRWALLPRSLTTCMACGRLAQWEYAPVGTRMDYCDDCVPRGCSCNVIDRPNPGKTVIDPPDASSVELISTEYGDIEPEQLRDERGRLLPCADYDFHRWGWKRQTEEG